MSDPFAPDSHNQLIREAQRGLAIIGILGLIFGYIAIQKFRGQWNGIPEHVKNSPPSQTVWPYDESIATRLSREDNRLVSKAATHSIVETNPDMAASRVSRSTESEIAYGSTSRQSATQSPFAHSVAPSQIESAEPDSLNPIPSRSELAAFESEIETSSGLSESSPPSKTKEKQKEYPELPIPRANDEDFQSQFKPIPKSTIGSESKSASAQLPRDPFGFSDSPIEQDKPEPPAKRVDGIDFHAIPLPVSSDTKTEDPTPEEKTVGNEFKMNASKTFVSAFKEDFSPDLASKLNEKKSGKPELMAPKVNDSNGLTPSPHSQTSFSNPTSSMESNSAKPGDVSDSGIEYTVKQGDNFWSIATDHYDDGRYFRPLFEFNIGRVDEFESPKPGTKIIIPPVAKLRSEYPALCKLISFTPREGDTRTGFPTKVNESPKILAAQPITTAAPLATGKTYVTRDQDTLFKIAAEELGQASRYLELIELNRSNLPPKINDSTPLAAGLNLILP